MKTFLIIVLLPLFLTVQSMASICSSQCALDQWPGMKVIESSSEHQGCHSESQESSSSQNKRDCSTKICQLDEVVQPEMSFIDKEISSKILIFSAQVELTISGSLKLQSIIFTTGPPGASFLKIPLYIKKSSYLI